MTKKVKSDKKSLIIACAALIAVILITVITLLSLPKKVDDNYFVSDDSKYVLTLDSDEILDFDLEGVNPEKTHLVYFYSGDNITGLKVYYDFKTEEAAKKAAELMKEKVDESVKELSIDGKYVVVVMNESEYKDMTAKDAKDQIELMEMLKNLDLEEGEEEEKTEE